MDKSKDSKQIDKKQSYLGPTRWCQAKSWKEAIDCKFLSAIQFPGILIVNLQWLAPTTLIDGGRGHVDDEGGRNEVT